MAGYLPGWLGVLCVSLHGRFLRLETEHDHHQVGSSPRPQIRPASQHLVRRFENSELPVTELHFPAVTVCSQGLNMDNVAKAVERDFLEWHQAREQRRGRARRAATAATLRALMAVYLQEKFDISSEDPGILEIIQSTSAVGGATAAQAEAVTKTVKKCSAEVGGQDEDVEEEEANEAEAEEVEGGSWCAVMRDQALLSTNSSLVTAASGQACADSCHRAPHCAGYTWAPGSCSLAHSLGRYVPQPGTVTNIVTENNTYLLSISIWLDT